MSSTTVLAVVPDRRPYGLAEFRNSWGWGPSIWQRICTHRGLGNQWDSPALDDLLLGIETLDEWEQAALILTLDYGVIPWQAFDWCADGLAEFDAKLPEQPHRVNHVPTMVDLLREKPEAPMIGVWGTSVSENPFDPWDGDADAPANGLPLDALFVLPQHRQYVGEAR